VRVVVKPLPAARGDQALLRQVLANPGFVVLTSSREGRDVAAFERAIIDVARYWLTLNVRPLKLA
jgi:hypothetical protein